MVRMEAVRRELRGSAIALVLVAATTLVAYVLIQSFDVRRGSVIYLLPVLLAGWHLGLVPALVAAVAGRAVVGIFFLLARTTASISPGRTRFSICCCSWSSPW